MMLNGMNKRKPPYSAFERTPLCWLSKKSIKGEQHCYFRNDNNKMRYESTIGFRQQKHSVIIFKIATALNADVVYCFSKKEDRFVQ
jgi:hypothetical protein